MKALLLSLLTIPTAFGASIKDYNHYNYEVYFTNPECKAYEYDETVYSFAGNVLNAKPANVYCKRGDKKPNQKRKESPHYNIKKLVLNKDVKELFLTYLSFSNSDIAGAVCDAIKKNNTKVTFIIDSKNKPDEGRRARLDLVASCKPAKKFIDQGVANYPRVEFRGNNGGLGYAHNKIIMAKYKSAKDKVTIVYSSGNMSSGTVLHHENWHFLTTSTKSYIAQAHECIREGMLDHSKTRRRNRSEGRNQSVKAIDNFKNYIKECRAKIDVKPESDIQLYIVPSDGTKAMNRIVSAMKKSEKIDVAVHRFTHRSLISGMKRAAKAGKEVRLVADDDLFWTGKVNEKDGKINCRNGEQVGANMCNEFFNMKGVEKSGVEVKFLETNHNSKLLHHNKYVVFHYKNGKGAVHCGAGNFTKAAFTKNFENFYFITIPEVVEKFKKQYNYKFSNLATSEKDLPSKMQMP